MASRADSRKESFSISNLSRQRAGQGHGHEQSHGQHSNRNNKSPGISIDQLKHFHKTSQHNHSNDHDHDDNNESNNPKKWGMQRFKDQMLAYRDRHHSTTYTADAMQHGALFSGLDESRQSRGDGIHSPPPLHHYESESHFNNRKTTASTSSVSRKHGNYGHEPHSPREGRLNTIAEKTNINSGYNYNVNINLARFNHLQNENRPENHQRKRTSFSEISFSESFLNAAIAHHNR